MSTPSSTSEETNFRFIDAEDLPWWCSDADGVSFKTLRYDETAKHGAVMVHMIPGTTYPVYEASAGQDVYVVDGELLLGDSVVRRGSYAWVPPGAHHAPRTVKGCVLFVCSLGRVAHDH